MKKLEKIPFLVIGAGPSGLAAALRLDKKAVVLEKEDRPGGICRSFQFKGGFFDLGGHSLHTPYPEIHEMVEQVTPGGLYGQKRDARCYSLDTLIPYPFQKNFEHLPDRNVVEECRQGLEKKGDPSSAGNFEEYILLNFGQGIAKYFMLPYNRKIWARDLRRISTEWVSQRVAAPAGTKETFKTKGGKRTPLQDDTRVFYPAKGGFGEIFKGLAKKIHRIIYNKELTRINLKRKQIITKDGQTFLWNKMISTLPLPELLKTIEGAPENIKQEINELEHMSLKLVFLLISQKDEMPIQRIYSADPSTQAHKISLNHNSSLFLKGIKKGAIICEVSYSEEKPVDTDRLAENLTTGLLKMNIIRSKKEVEFSQIHDLKYAYPVYTKRRLEIVKNVKKWLSVHDIYTLGRFGEWMYINSDEAIVRGLSLADKLLSDQK